MIEIIYKLFFSDKKLILLSLFVFFSFCSRERPVTFDKDHLSPLELVKEFQLSDSEEIQFGFIRDIHLDDHNNIYVLDWGRQSIVIFSNEGELRDEFVNRGEGPGEYVALKEFFIKNSSLFLVDDSQLKVAEFEISNAGGRLTHIRDTIYPDRAFTRIEYFWVLDEETLIFVFFKKGFAPHNLWDDKFAGVQLFDKQNQTYREIFEVPGREYFRYDNEGGFGVRFLPFGRYPVFVFTGEELFYGSNSEFKIEKMDLDGTITSTVLDLDVQADPVTQEETRVVIENDYYKNRNAQQEIREQLPEVWRLYDTFVLDDKGRIWFAVNKDGRRGGELWWVFDQKGNGLFKVELEEPVLFKKIRNGQAYGIHISEMDTHSLIKYSFEEPGN